MEFVRFIEDEITFFLDTNASPDISYLTLWDTLKAFLRGQIIAYTAGMKRKSIQEQNELICKIGEIDKQYAQKKCPDLYKKRVELKTRFDLLTTYQIEQLLLRNRTLFYTYGDKSDKSTKGF